MREVKCSASARARFGSSDKDSRGEGSGGVYREADQGTRLVHAAAGRGRSREEIQERWQGITKAGFAIDSDTIFCGHFL